MFQLPGDPTLFFDTDRSTHSPGNDDRYELIGGDAAIPTSENAKRFEVDQGGDFRGDSNDVNFYQFQGDNRRGEKRSRLLIR
jgi:hypothetical protein